MSDETVGVLRSEDVPQLVVGGVLTPDDGLVAGLKSYRDLQSKLDSVLERATVKIGSKLHRTKEYWCAVQASFNLDCHIVKEEFSQLEQPPWWPFPEYAITIVCRATAPNGRSADGDGACTASEKAVFRKVKGKPKIDADGWPEVNKFETMSRTTIHNVRSQAVTRAANRALARLVGFGEVSAEEISGLEGGEQVEVEPTPPKESKKSPPKKKPMKLGKFDTAGVAEGRESMISWLDGTHEKNHYGPIPDQNWDELIFTASQRFGKFGWDAVQSGDVTRSQLLATYGELKRLTPEFIEFLNNRELEEKAKEVF